MRDVRGSFLVFVGIGYLVFCNDDTKDASRSDCRSQENVGIPLHVTSQEQLWREPVENQLSRNQTRHPSFPKSPLPSLPIAAPIPFTSPSSILTRYLFTSYHLVAHSNLVPHF